MADTGTLFPIADLTALVAVAHEPFIVPDVTPRGWKPSVVFHILRDLVDAGVLLHGPDGYRRAA